MCSIATRQLVENSIQDFISRAEAFTAYDVTKDVRFRDSKVSERHHELKREVHQLFNDGGMGNYGRQLIRLASAPTPAFLYHPPGYDTSSYASQSTPAATTPPVSPVPAITPNHPVFVGTNSAGVTVPAGWKPSSSVVRLDTQGNGFVRIPASMVRDVGLKPGDDAAIEVTNGASGKEIRITTCQTCWTGRSYAVPYAVQKVDPRGNVRIYALTLSKAGKFNHVFAEVAGSAIRLY